MKSNLALLSAGLLGALVFAAGGCSSTSGLGRGGGGLGGRGTLARNAPALGIHVDLIPEGKYGRHVKRPMRPRFITVHSTQTYGSSANAATMARALRNGNLTATHNLLGYLTWHFSVDQGSVYQSLPLNERGEHADYEGQGNKESIGIEMCENRGNSIPATVDRTAKLCAVLMAEYGIPLQNIVPHYHWEQIRPRTGKNLGHKNCPHFLMDNGKPGAKWQGFLRKVDGYSKQLQRSGRI